jgi:hypothetical protein
MSQDLQEAQLEVLSRITYMLDENSVKYLVQQDPGFQKFIDNLQHHVENQAVKIIN